MTPSKRTLAIVGTALVATIIAALSLDREREPPRPPPSPPRHVLLAELARRYKVSEQEIAEVTAHARAILKHHGIERSELVIMRDLAEIPDDVRGSLNYAEVATLYVVARTE